MSGRNAPGAPPHNHDTRSARGGRHRFAAPRNAGRHSCRGAPPQVQYRGGPASSRNRTIASGAESLRALVLVALLAACAPKQQEPGAWQEGDGHRWRELAVGVGKGAGFTAMAPSRTGVRFVNRVPADSIFANRHLAHGAGVALGDVDGDGRTDVFVAGTIEPSALYRNAGGWKFEDVTARSGITTAGRHATGAAFADVDGDGDQDLLVAMLGAPLALWVNDGKGRFTDGSRSAGFDAAYGATSLALADVDADGDLDLYVATYKTRNAMDVYPPQVRAFDQVVRRRGDRYEVVDRFRADFRVTERADLGAVVRTQRADPDLFYINDGRGRFSRQPLAGSPRFLDEDGKPLAEEPDFFGLAAAFHDVNADGRPDLYVCNDFEDPDQVWINQGAGTFRLIDRRAIRATSNSCMSVAFADVDADGAQDIFTADMLALEDGRRKTQVPTHTPLPKRAGLEDDRPQMQRNALQLSRGDGTFAQAAEAAGVDASGWTWGSAFSDVDLDGRPDLLLATGHVHDVMDADTWERIRTQHLQYDWRREIGLFPRLPLRNVAFRNRGDGTFENASATWRFGTAEDVSHAVATADLDGDGDEDAVVTRLDAEPLLLRSDARAGRVLVRLRGEAGNTAGVGARVHVRAGTLPVQSREVQGAGLYLAGSDGGLTFATGDADSLTIDVTWPGGARSVVRARPNREYVIMESGAKRILDGDRPTAAPPLFSDASSLLGHRHADSLFDDFARQPLLDMRLSQLGPGASWADVDGDGDEDLLVPSGRGGSLAFLRNDGGRFARVALGGVAALDQTSALAVPGADGRLSLLVGQATWEAESPAAALAAARVLQLGVRGTPAPAIAGDTASAGAMALADVDTDGDLDLFVGGRAVPGSYPVAGASRLYRNEGGRWVADAVIADAGLVSGAIFSDVDADGDPDLVLAVDWGPIRLHLNTGGRFAAAPASWGLGELAGRWNGIAAGDLDGDGRMDLVATSWGRNVRHRASRERPLVLLAGNFDDNGSLDLLETRWDPERKAHVPLVGLGRLTVAAPSLRARVGGYAAFADMTAEQLLGDRMARTARLQATTLEHVMLINRGGRFEARPLPAAAQLAPSFGVTVADFDGDGHEDVALAQNFFQTEIESPRYDAGRGLLLLGDGRGGLRPVPASGIVAWGDQRGVATADYDRDGRADLAIAQNGGETKLFHNTGGRPGLRVRIDAGVGNPNGYGATVRVTYADGTRGPAREIHGGGGFWSLDGATAVLGLAGEPRSIVVRWPGGAETTTDVPRGERNIVVRRGATLAAGGPGR